MTSNETTHVHITRPAFTVRDAISAMLLRADAAKHIPSRTNVGTFFAVRLEDDGQAYVIGKSGRVIGLPKGEKLSPETLAAIHAAKDNGAYVDLAYSSCQKAVNAFGTAQKVADYWQETGKAFTPDNLSAMVGAVDSAIRNGKAGASKPDQIFELLTDVDLTAEESIALLGAAVQKSRNAASKKERKPSTPKSLTAKATEALEALATAIASGGLIPDATEWQALTAASAVASQAFAALEKSEVKAA